jgi:hypothetical protein
MTGISLVVAVVAGRAFGPGGQLPEAVQPTPGIGVQEEKRRTAWQAWWAVRPPLPSVIVREEPQRTGPLVPPPFHRDFAASTRRINERVQRMQEMLAEWDANRGCPPAEREAQRTRLLAEIAVMQAEIARDLGDTEALGQRAREWFEQNRTAKGTRTKQLPPLSAILPLF